MLQMIKVMIFLNYTWLPRRLVLCLQYNDTAELDRSVMVHQATTSVYRLTISYYQVKIITITRAVSVGFD